MKQYVALLRGVNVGGKNKISMPQFRQALEQAGFSQVSTYINSGNLLFSCAQTDTVALQQRCRQIILDHFALDIPVAVLCAEAYADALAHAPPWWDEAPDSKHIAVFVIAPAVAGALVEEVGSRPEYEQVARHGQVIFWSAPLKTFSRTRWSKVMASSSYGSITIRNANTAKKLYGLVQSSEITQQK